MRMSRDDYVHSQDIAAQGYPFYALIMAAMRKADTDNLEKLRRAFPATHDELVQRYSAPAGYLPHEPKPWDKKNEI
jgi:hypothetical protein